jgi:hypothetical protein
MNPLTRAQHGSDHKQVEAQLATRIEEWRALVDDVKLQIHLGPREVRDRVAPLLKKLEHELRHTKGELRQLEGSADGEWSRIHHSLQNALRCVELSLEQVRRSIEQSDEA